VKDKPIRDKKLLEYVRSLPCMITQDGEYCNGQYVVPHHLTFIKSESRIGGKAGDDKTVSLCLLHHTALHSMGEKAFWQSWKIDLKTVEAIAKENYEIYKEFINV
jgi:hypothetical protein